jgi:Tol biopolymer transport system component
VNPGTRIASYEILALIGEGGMGEVYRARDSKLKRDVALKVLPETFARDLGRMGRFQREAEVLASLNNPNIAHIYGLEDGALVMELVEGESPKGPMPFEDAWKIASQIADALGYAHDNGIIHRDLKPANIKVTPDGVVKLLDFGLAKAFGDVPEPASADPSNSPTLTFGATAAGTIMGTAAYMAPEQARGKSVDKRADIWSWGVVFYELLTGEPLYKGEDTSEILAAVIKEDPPLDRVPEKAQRLLRKCLEKDPKRRLRDIGDAMTVLEDAGPISAPSRSRLSWLAWGLAGAFFLLAAGIGTIHFREVLPETPALHATILPPDNTNLDFANGMGLPALSPDGRKIVFGARTSDGKNPLWVRSLDALVAQPLAGTDGAAFPFWSPDSRFIAFFVDGKLKKMDASGGPTLTLADAPLARGGSWGRDGVIVYAPVNTASPLMRVSSAGGTPSAINTTTGRLPWFLPDGRHFLYQSSLASNREIRVASLDGGESKAVTEAGSNALFAQGHLLFLREGTLMVEPFDAARLVVTGEAVPVAEQVQSVLNSGTVGVFSVSSNGMLAYRTGTRFNGLRLTWFDLSGKPGATVGAPGNFNSFRLSPDGKRVVASVAEPGNTDIWIYDISSGLRKRLTFDPALDIDPVWSPDGRSIAFRSNRNGQFGLYRKSADLTGNEELLYADNADKSLTSWSGDGKFLLYSRIDSKTGNDLWGLPLTAERPGEPLKPFRVLQTPLNEQLAEFSPDGKWIAWTSSESQGVEVYVAPFLSASSGLGSKRQVSTAGGRLPRWRQDGKELFYMASDLRLMAAEVIFKGGTLEIGQVRPLFTATDVTGGTPFYDVSPDGQHFLFRRFSDEKSSEPLTLIQNWTAALKK